MTCIDKTRVIGRRAALLGAGLALAPGLARAQQGAFPVRPLRMVVPWAPGGFTDVAARLVAEKMRPELGQPVVVENRAGGPGVVGTEWVSRAAPDGYTMIMATADTHVINPYLYRTLPYDAAAFTPIGGVAVLPLSIIVQNNLGIGSFADFIAYAKARPGALRFGSWGEGGTGHLALEDLRARTGIEVLHVPYRGSGPMTTDFVAGQLDFVFLGVGAALGLQRDGRGKVLAVTIPERHPALPDLPAIAELVPGYSIQLWYGIMGPAGMPAPIVARLNQAVRQALATPELRERLDANHAIAMPGSPEDFAAFVRSEHTRWAEIIRRSGVQLG